MAEKATLFFEFESGEEHVRGEQNLIPSVGDTVVLHLKDDKHRAGIVESIDWHYYSSDEDSVESVEVYIVLQDIEWP